jgi:hypothetical protein
MKDVRAHLRDGDPFRTEGGLSAIESARMRAVVVAVAPPQRLVPWRPFLAIAAGLVGVVTAGAWSVGQTSSANASNTAVSSDRATAESELGALRQVYFSTPGGTRVIWQFNQTFELR